MNDDTISRAAALNALCDNCDTVQAVCPHFPCKRYTSIEALLSTQPEITLESAIDYLHSIGWMQNHDRILIESAQPKPSQVARDIATIIENEKDMRVILQQPKWTPCSEQLPKKIGDYLVTDHNGQIARYIYLNTDASKEYWMRCAIAWMPLPKPYGGNDHEAN